MGLGAYHLMQLIMTEELDSLDYSVVGIEVLQQKSPDKSICVQHAT